MKSNSSLTDALTGLIPDKEVLMINVAENSGKISSGIAAIRKTLSMQMRSNLKLSHL